jgi:hypothetical protein
MSLAVQRGQDHLVPVRQISQLYGPEAEIQNQDPRNDSPKTQMSIPHSYPTEKEKKKNV